MEIKEKTRMVFPITSVNWPDGKRMSFLQKKENMTAEKTSKKPARYDLGPIILNIFTIMTDFITFEI